MMIDERDDFTKPGRGQRSINKAKKRREDKSRGKIGPQERITRKRITERDVYTALDEVDLNDE